MKQYTEKICKKILIWKKIRELIKRLVKDRVNKATLMLVLQYIIYSVIQLRGLLVRVTFLANKC
jgi:hypothetical protein